MGNIKYYLNKGVGSKKDRPLMVSYHFNGQRLRYYSGLRIAEVEFNQDSKDTPVNSKCTDQINYNNRLKLVRNFIGEIENEALAGGKIVTPDLIREQLNYKLKSKPMVVPAGKITLLKYFDIYIEDAKVRTNQKTGRKLSKAMPVKYNNVKNLFTDFCTHEGRRYDFEDINENFYKRFVAYMLNEKKYSVNTYGRALKFLKTLISKATKDGINNNLYYQNIVGVQEASESIYLNTAELSKIYKLDLSKSPHLDRVRDLFIIGCNTGLRFSDYTTIKPDDIQGDCLRIVTKKTNSKVIIPLMPDARAILQKYNFQLPKAISNQKFNKYLKDIAEEAGLKDIIITHMTKGGEAVETKQLKYELVTSHVARRSFATNYYKMGVDSLQIMAITGHKTEKEFMKYIKVTGEEKADLFEKSVKDRQKVKTKTPKPPKNIVKLQKVV
ncbi:site-specific integrase [Candidatus Nomurabacteria bacterium]|nr:site-specific integrase [Candidatus Nomurabacteria bacterium]